MLNSYIKLEGLKGVGTVELTLDEAQRVFTFIGENGIGKTKTLEALFQILFFGNEQVGEFNIGPISSLVFSHGSCKEKTFQFEQGKYSPSYRWKLPQLITGVQWTNDKSEAEDNTKKLYSKLPQHNLPVVFVASQHRGLIQQSTQASQSIGSLAQRHQTYLLHIIQQMEKSFSNLSLQLDIEAWFVTLAKSANPYQDKVDNREVEIKVVLRLLHQIDERIDQEYISISGDERVSLKVAGEKRELSQLSSGFTSILKIIQTIISGYGYFTNETRLQDVKGIVLIDEIESHLHASWQSNIIPLLKRLFPNTTFYISTHSPIVLSQLQQGEAYQLVRNEQGIVQSRLINSPNKVALVDALKDAFGIDINRQKLDRLLAEDQQAAKQKLLSLLLDEVEK